MTIAQVLLAILELSRSQGFYGRLYDWILSLTPEQYLVFTAEMEEENFNNVMDIIFYFECDCD